jgi:hypothetical protein
MTSLETSLSYGPHSCCTSIDAYLHVHSKSVSFIFSLFQNSQENYKKPKKSNVFVTFVTFVSRCISQKLFSSSFFNYQDFGTRTTSLVRLWVEISCWHTDRYTHTQIHTQTDTQTHGHEFFYCFIVFRDLENIEKNHKKWGSGNFYFRMNSILRQFVRAEVKIMKKNFIKH